jgi:uncharacterized protein YndB with AHSA1/START domain
MPDTAQSAVSIELSRRFDAPPERVFDAWVSKSWCEWMGPAGTRCEIMELEPRVGGRFHLRCIMQDGRTVDLTGQYREMIRPERLVMNLIGDCTRFDTVLTITFRRDGKGTLMTLRQEGFPDPAIRDGFIRGWSGPGNAFDRLAKVLAV